MRFYRFISFVFFVFLILERTPSYFVHPVNLSSQTIKSQLAAPSNFLEKDKSKPREIRITIDVGVEIDYAEVLEWSPFNPWVLLVRIILRDPEWDHGIREGLYHVDLKPRTFKKLVDLPSETRHLKSGRFVSSHWVVADLSDDSSRDVPYPAQVDLFSPKGAKIRTIVQQRCSIDLIEYENGVIVLEKGFPHTDLNLRSVSIFNNLGRLLSKRDWINGFTERISLNNGGFVLYETQYEKPSEIQVYGPDGLPRGKPFVIEIPQEKKVLPFPPGGYVVQYLDEVDGETKIFIKSFNEEGELVFSDEFEKEMEPKFVLLSNGYFIDYQELDGEEKRIIRRTSITATQKEKPEEEKPKIEWWEEGTKLTLSFIPLEEDPSNKGSLGRNIEISL